MTRIQPTSALPSISDRVVIDGTTQHGFAGTPLIRVDGASAGSSDGLDVAAGSSTVRGLQTTRWNSAGILIESGGGNTITGNYIGGNGSSALPNSIGVLVRGSSSNQIGGLTGATRNVISGNSGNGVVITGAGASANLVQGNRIGTNAAGTARLANQSGVVIQSLAHDNLIGGTTAAARNLLSGNGQRGVAILYGAHDNKIQGNFIGTDAAGTGPLALARRRRPADRAGH